MSVKFLDVRKAAANLGIENYAALSKDGLMDKVSEILDENIMELEKEDLEDLVKNYLAEGIGKKSETKSPEPEEVPEEEEIPSPEEPEDPEPEPEPVKEAPKSAAKPRATSRTSAKKADPVINITKEVAPEKVEEAPKVEDVKVADCTCAKGDGSLKPGAIAIKGVAKFLDNLSYGLMELNKDLSIDNLSK